jgi:hypothetical protein
MLHDLLKSYWNHGYNYHFSIEPRGESCINVKQRPNCPGFHPYITITTTQGASTKLTATLILDCDECRRTCTNPYVKSSMDVDLVIKVKVSGIGEICRRERQGDYNYFEELRYIHCDVCQTTFHMPRTVYDQHLDGEDPDSMQRRSAMEVFKLHCLMTAAKTQLCHSNHGILLSALDDTLDEFQMAINRNSGQSVSLVYNLTGRYLYWRFVDNDEPYSFEDLYDKLILLLMARKYDKTSLMVLLPMEIITRIFKLATQDWHLHLMVNPQNHHSK